jgi:hypothetical protein
MNSFFPSLKHMSFVRILILIEAPILIPLSGGLREDFKSRTESISSWPSAIQLREKVTGQIYGLAIINVEFAKSEDLHATGI